MRVQLTFSKECHHFWLIISAFRASHLEPVLLIIAFFFSEMGSDLHFLDSSNTKLPLRDACLMSHPCFPWKTLFSSTIAFYSLLMHLHKMNILQLGCCNLGSLIMKVILMSWWSHDSGMYPSFFLTGSVFDFMSLRNETF